MNWKQIRNLDKQLASSFLAVFILTAIGLVASQFYNKHPVLRYEVLSEAPVYDVREDVTNLDIYFEAQSIRQQHETLSLITVKVENTGNATILKPYSYDPDYLPGFRIPASRIVRVDALGASNEYITNQLRLIRQSTNEYVFSPIILNKSDFFVLKFLVLHSETVTPALEPLGMIASSPPISVSPAPLTTEHKSFFVRAVFGDLLVQGTRILVYTMGGAFLIIGAVIFITATAEKCSRARRKYHVKKYKRSLVNAPSKALGFILDAYLRYDAERVVQLNQLLGNPGLLNSISNISGPTPGFFPGVYDMSPSGMVQIWPPKIEALLENGVVERRNNKLVTKPDVLADLKHFETFLSAVIPNKVIKARREEPFGTESKPVVDQSSLATPATNE